jgi:DNA topoisomerase-3
MRKLLSAGKTDLLQFVSARTRRPFSAFLVRQPDGRIGFEFAPRAGAKAKGASKAVAGSPSAPAGTDAKVYPLRDAEKQGAKATAPAGARAPAKRAGSARKVAKKVAAKKPAAGKRIA